MSVIIGFSITIVGAFATGFIFGKISGISQTYEHLEKEGKIIKKNELNDLIK